MSVDPTTPTTTTDPVQAALAAAQGSSGKSGSSNALVNLQAAQIAAQVANWAAQLEFAKQRFQLLELPQFQHASQMDIDRLAFEKATQAWQQAFNEATLTGTYQGQPTQQWLTQQAQLTGVLNGNQTLQGKLTDAQVAQMSSAMKIAQDDQLLRQQQFGFQQTQWNAEFALQKAAQTMQYTGYTDTGAPTLGREAQTASITGYDLAGNPTLARQAQESSEAMQLMQFLSGLRGPQNAFAQLRALGNVPGSMQDVANALLGRYQIGGTTGSGQNPTPANMYSLFGYGAPGSGMGALPPGAPQAGDTIGAYTFQGAAPLQTPGAAANAPAYGAAQQPWMPGANVNPAAGPGQTPGAPPGPAGPTPFIAVPADTGPIPGRGFDPSQWDQATRNAVAAWNLAHPGFTANGSQLGYGYTGPVPPQGGTFDFTQPIPGRGIPRASWNPATMEAARAWAAAHPGFIPDGSQAGYRIEGGLDTIPGILPDPVTGQIRPGVVTPQPATTYPEPGYPPAPGPIAGSAPPQGPPQGVVQPQPPTHSADSAAAAVASQAAVSPMAHQAVSATETAPVGYSPQTPDVAPAVRNAVGEAAATQPLISPPGTQAPPAMYNYTPTATGAMQVHPPGAVADSQGYQFSTNMPASQQDQSSWLASVLPNQINAENYGNLNQYAQDVTWAGFEDIGWDPSAAQSAFKKSLPRYGGPGGGSFAGLG